jgi:hypothetical protein
MCEILVIMLNGLVAFINHGMVVCMHLLMRI